MNLSPYELLCSCKPKPPQTTVTPYDLFSAVQAREESGAPAQAPEPAPPPAQEVALPPPARRTHYIAQIRARHEQAQRRPVPPPPRG